MRAKRKEESGRGRDNQERKDQERNIKRVDSQNSRVIWNGEGGGGKPIS